MSAVVDTGVAVDAGQATAPAPPAETSAAATPAPSLQQPESGVSQAGVPSTQSPGVTAAETGNVPDQQEQEAQPGQPKLVDPKELRTAYESLKQQAVIKIDAPAGEWNFKEQFDKIPPAYQQKAVDEIFWSTLDNTFKNFDTLPETVKSAFGARLVAQVEAEYGIPLQVLHDVAMKIRSGEIDPANVVNGTGPNQNGMPGPTAQQLIAQGYAPDDPLVQTTYALEQATMRERQYAQQIAGVQTETKKIKEAQDKAARDASLGELRGQEATARQGMLNTVLEKVPKGYEPMRDVYERLFEAAFTHPDLKAIRDRAEALHLDGAKPIAQGEMARLSAAAALKVQNQISYMQGIVAENERLKGLVGEKQGARIEIPPGGLGPQPAGTLPPRNGYDLDYEKQRLHARADELGLPR